jgi:FkbM family methyltransferase
MRKIFKSLISWGASFPVWMKGGMMKKVFNRLLLHYRKKYPVEALIFSNFGIDNKLKIALPVLQAPSTFFFGKPTSYTGEFYTLRLAALLSQHCSTFIDVGANWGFFSYYISRHNSSLPVYWFEPNISLYENISLNAGNNKFINMHGSLQALSDTNGTMTFYIEQGAGFNSSLIKPDSGPVLTERTVETIRFEDWLQQNNIGKNLLVKVDVENAEWHFIKGAINAMSKIEFLVIEVLGPARQSGFINYMIQELKLNAYYINENKIEQVLKEDMRYTKGEYNWLFCRYNPEILKEKLTDPLFIVLAGN